MKALGWKKGANYYVCCMGVDVVVVAHNEQTNTAASIRKDFIVQRTGNGCM